MRPELLKPDFSGALPRTPPVGNRPAPPPSVTLCVERALCALIASACRIPPAKVRPIAACSL